MHVFLFICMFILTLNISCTNHNSNQRILVNNNLHKSYIPYAIETVDPIEAIDSGPQFIINNAFDGLLEWSPKGVSGQLARKWEFDKEYKVLKFYLKENLRFSDGQVLTANHIKDHFNRLLKSKYYKNHFSNIKRMVSESNTITFFLKKRDADFVNLLASSPTRIIKKTKNSIVGAGPYSIEIKSEGEEVLLNKNSFYYNNEPYIEKIVFKHIPTQSLEKAVSSKEIDDLILTNLDPSRFPHNGNWLTQNMWATWVIAFDQRVAPFNKREVRKSIYDLINKELFISSFFPKNIMATGLFAFGAPGYLLEEEIEFLPISTEKLTQNLSGIIEVPKEIYQVDKVAKWINERQKNNATIDVKVKIVPFNDMMSRYAQGKIGAYLISLTAEYPDPAFLLRALHSKSGSNFLGINNKYIDDLVAKLESTKSSVEKSQILKKANKFLMRDYSLVPIMHVHHSAWVRDCVEGIQLNPISEAYFSLRKVVNRCK